MSYQTPIRRFGLLFYPQKRDCSTPKETILRWRIILFQSVSRDGSFYWCRKSVESHKTYLVWLGRICQRRVGCRVDSCIDSPTIGYGEAYQRRLCCLFKILVGFTEGVSSIHQDHIVGCKESQFDAHPAYRQNGSGD